MALSTSSIVDKALRRLPAQSRPDPGDIEQWVNGALQRLCRSAIKAEYRKLLESQLSLTLGAADAYGVQSVVIPATHLPESIAWLDAEGKMRSSVIHSDLAAVGPLIYKPCLAEILPPYVYSSSIYGYFAVDGPTLYVRRPSAALVTTSNALKVHAVQMLTAVTSVPVGVEGLMEDFLIMSAPDYTPVALQADAAAAQESAA